MSARDQATPVLDTLNAELQQATDAGRGVRLTQQFAQQLLDMVGGVLDQLDEATRPRDDRLREKNLLLKATARELLGPGDRDLFTLPDAAKALREAAGVDRSQDINVLLEQVSQAREVAGKPEYGPGSRWQAIRDQTAQISALRDDLVKQLSAAQQIADSSLQAVTAIHGQLEQAKTVVRAATWVTEPKGWLLTDQERNDILELGVELTI